MKLLPLLAALLSVLVETSFGWNQESVLLRDIQALTFYKNRYTTAKRSSPIPQLQCVGGSAGCHVFIPETVQCVNRGWDGVDVQWECKTDMDDAYKFGVIAVSCEGYTHPSDDYILKGSCGLEYTLELTQGGQRKTQGNFGSQGGFQQQGGLGGFASSLFSGIFGNKRHHQQQHHHQQQQQQNNYAQDGESSGGLIVVAVLLLLAYGVYKLFLSGDTVQSWQSAGQAGYSQDNPPNNMGGPHPPGFKPDYQGFPGANPGYGFQSDYTNGQQYPRRQGGAGAGGGFWTGIGTGGMLGYLFGRQRAQSYHPPSAGGNYSSGTNATSGTRTASGFGGTKRR